MSAAEHYKYIYMIYSLTAIG